MTISNDQLKILETYAGKAIEENSLHQSVVNEVCIELMENPFVVLQIPLNVLSFYPVFTDILSKREFKSKKSLSESEQIKAVVHCSSLIDYIEKPTDAAVFNYLLKGHQAPKKNSVVCEKFKGFRKEFQNIILQKNGLFLNLIENPTEEQEILSIQQNGRALDYCKNVTKSKRLLAISTSPILIADLDNTDLEEQMIAFWSFHSKKHPLMELGFKHFKNPFPEIVDLAVQHCPIEVLKYYPQNIDLCIRILQQDPSCYQYVNIVSGDSNEEVFKLLLNKKNLEFYITLK